MEREGYTEDAIYARSIMSLPLSVVVSLVVFIIGE